jgi:hypothetical protein
MGSGQSCGFVMSTNNKVIATEIAVDLTISTKSFILLIPYIIAKNETVTATINKKLILVPMQIVAPKVISIVFLSNELNPLIVCIKPITNNT